MSEEYTRRGRNWLTAMGVLFLVVANENNLYIICDEIYDQIVYGKKFVGIGKVAGDSPVIILNGFSKVHLMSGWRIGYIAFITTTRFHSRTFTKIGPC